MLCREIGQKLCREVAALDAAACNNSACKLVKGELKKAVAVLSDHRCNKCGTLC